VLKVSGNFENEFATGSRDAAISQKQGEEPALFVLGPAIAGKIFPHKQLMDHVMGKEKIFQLGEMFFNLVARPQPATPENQDLLFFGGPRQALSRLSEVTNALMEAQDFAVLA
jgi:hypothetical protein